MLSLWRKPVVNLTLERNYCVRMESFVLPQDRAPAVRFLGRYITERPFLVLMRLRASSVVRAVIPYYQRDRLAVNR